MKCYLLGKFAVAFPYRKGGKFLMKMSYGSAKIELFKDTLRAEFGPLPLIKIKILEVPIKNIKKVQTQTQVKLFGSLSKYLRVTYKEKGKEKEVIMFLGSASEKWEKEIKKLMKR